MKKIKSHTGYVQACHKEGRIWVRPISFDGTTVRGKWEEVKVEKEEGVKLRKLFNLD